MQPKNSVLQEFREIWQLAVGFGCALGCYWMLREMKNALFMELVGPLYLPQAKLLSIAVLIVLLMVYSKLVDLVGKRKLLFTVYSVYAAIFSVLVAALHFQGGQPWLGWGFYLAIESFGSLGISHLWSLAVNATPDSDVASRRFPLLAVGGQVGAVFCSAAVFFLAHRWGLVSLLCMAILLLCLAPAFTRAWLLRYHVEDQITHRPKDAGSVEGIRLVFSRPYLMAIAMIVISYEFIGTYMDFQMNMSAKATYGSLEQVTRFLALYGLTANTISFIFALTGTGYLVRHLGLSACLVTYPILLAMLVLIAAGTPGVWTFFFCQMALKGIAYGFNKPCLEMLYVPTSEAIQFKAKSWIDTAGSRSGKALGSMMNASYALSALLVNGAATCLGVVLIWIPIAYKVGSWHKRMLSVGDHLE